MTPTGTEARVCQDIAERQERGIAKYGTTVADNPLSLEEWLQHAYEETLDKAVYLKRAIEELQRKAAAFSDMKGAVNGGLVKLRSSDELLRDMPILGGRA
ncbi:hypothetical protein [Acidovorax phage AP1]|nr:hypothetical protein [Acidovorax phage AP1]